MRDNDGNLFTQWHSSPTTLHVPWRRVVYFARIEADNIHRCCTIRVFLSLSLSLSLPLPSFFVILVFLTRVASKNNTSLLDRAVQNRAAAAAALVITTIIVV